jgi:hypothetical protein
VIRLIRRQDASGIPITLEMSQTLSAGSWQPVSVLPTVSPVDGKPMEELLFRIPALSVESFFRLKASAPE